MERNTAKRTLEKLLSVCICLCMLGAMLPAQVFAEEADTAQTEIVQDTAPKDTVYLSSADDLIQLAKDCRLDSWSQNRTVVLEADIDLSSVDFNGIPSFGGTWEGQNHAITGLSLSQDGSVQGLFRYVQQGALVRDMTVKGRIKPAAPAPAWAALRAATPVRLKIARLTAWYPAPARLAALPVSIRSRAASTAAR